MSLQHIAHHIKAKGRGPDTELVHMTKGEVAGLQALAQSQGKHLTINPHTGLPEAGILSAILPAVTTAAATYFGGPQAGAWVAAAWGAKTYADTGSLTKGLITGIGAYGGSQLAAGMSPEMGTSALGGTSGAATSGSQTALADAGATNTGAQMSQADVLAQSGSPSMASNAGMGAAAPNAPVSSTSNGISDLATRTSEAGGTSGASTSTVKPEYVDVQTGTISTPVSGGNTPGAVQGKPISEPVSPTGADYEQMPASQQPAGSTRFGGAEFEPRPGVTENTYGRNFYQTADVGKTASSLGPEKSNWDILKQNSTMKNVGMALAPIAIQEPNRPAAPTRKVDSDMGQRYGYAPGYNKSTGTYTASDAYVPVSSTEAKALYGFADGGEVGSPGNTDADNAAKVQAHQNSMVAVQGGTTAANPANGPGAAPNYTGYASAPNIQSFTPTSGDTTGIAAMAPAKGYAYDAATGRFLGTGTDANYLGGGVWGLTAAEQAAKDKADAEAAAASAPPPDTSGGAANGGLMQSYADGGMTYGNGDVQGDPNLMQVKTYDPVVRMAGGGMFGGAIEDLIRQMKAKGAFDGANSSYTYNPDTQEYTRTAAAGGISNLGSYSDGGRLLKGPGDGVSDSIPAQIGAKQPARLADGEFVVPARIVSELGNGSTDAGARQLYKMMDRVQKARSKTTAKGKMAKNTNAAKYLPA